VRKSIGHSSSHSSASIGHRSSCVSSRETAAIGTTVSNVGVKHGFNNNDSSTSSGPRVHSTNKAVINAAIAASHARVILKSYSPAPPQLLLKDLFVRKKWCCGLHQYN
jgi:hypothetical protein